MALPDQTLDYKHRGHLFIGRPSVPFDVGRTGVVSQTGFLLQRGHLSLQRADPLPFGFKEIHLGQSGLVNIDQHRLIVASAHPHIDTQHGQATESNNARTIQVFLRAMAW